MNIAFTLPELQRLADSLRRAEKSIDAERKRLEAASPASLVNEVKILDKAQEENYLLYLKAVEAAKKIRADALGVTVCEHGIDTSKFCLLCK